MSESVAEPAYIAHVRRARAFEAAGRDLDALREFRIAESLAPGYEAAMKIGGLLVRLGKSDEALDSYLRALTYKPDSVPTLLALCRACADLFQDDEAMGFLDQAAAIDPSSSEVPLTRAHLFQMRGRFTEAERELEHAIAMDPKLGVAYHGLVGTRRLTAVDRPLVDRIRGALNGPGLTSVNEAYLHYALGKALDDLGEYEEAMTEFDSANRITLDTRIGARATNAVALADSIGARIAMFGSEFFSDASAGLPSDRPIFIVGMLRSGTTLLEQLISCHPSVAAAGELSFWVHAEARLVSYARQALNAPEVAAAAHGYLEITEPCTRAKGREPATRVTDKYPANFLTLGLIHAALPNARIVHVRRNPLDTALSLYMTPLRTPPPYGCDKQNIALYYKQYLRLVAHWRAVLPADRFTEVRYEDLVARPEIEVRRLLEFCGLEWCPACVHPEQNPRPVRTPSFWQVRQPLYGTSVGRWEHYRPWLGPLSRLIDIDIDK